MSVALRKNRTLKNPSRETEADRLARSMGGKPFKMADAVVATDFSDEELEELLKWRESKRESELEAQRNWQS